MKELLHKRLAYIYVFAGASLWGIIGLFIDALSSAGFSALQIVTLRCVSAALMLIAYLALTNPRALKIEAKDTLSFIGTGIFSIVFFNWCYFTAIEEISLSIAVILLYTGPAFVVLLSRIFLGEDLGKIKVAALLITLLGCMLVVGVIPFNLQNLSVYGLLVGLGSGFGYALYSIFGKHALKKYSPLTVITYTFVAASIALIPVSGVYIPFDSLADSRTLLYVAGLGFFPTALAYLLYTHGLSLIESGPASITATIEPVVATSVGVFVFGEQLSVLQLMGIGLVIFAVILIQLRKNPPVPVT